MKIKSGNKILKEKGLTKKVIKEGNEIGAELNAKQKEFCRQYCFDWNGTKAYLRTYPDATPQSAQAASSRLLLNVIIKEQIEYWKANVEEACGISKQMIIDEHRKLAFSSIAHLHNTWIERRDFEKLSNDEKACIEEIATQTKQIFDKNIGSPVEIEFVKVRLYNKQESLKELAKILGHHATEKHEVKFPDGLPVFSVTLPDKDQTQER
jgi:phage terminase small subunit